MKEQLINAFLEGRTKVEIRGVLFSGLPKMTRHWKDSENVARAEKLAEKQLEVFYS